MDVEKEKTQIKEMGWKEYLKTRKTKISLLGVLALILGSFILGAWFF